MSEPWPEVCNSVVRRSDVYLTEILQNFPSPEEIQHVKSRKKLVLAGAARFNAKPKTGVLFLEENKLIYADPDEPRPLSLAMFLKSSTRLDKRLLGDFISKPENLDVLKAFLRLFDFKDVRIPADIRSPSLSTDSTTETHC